MVCGGQTSRLEVTKEILSVIGMSNKIKINIVNSDFFKEEYFAARPISERLVNARLEQINMNLMRDWKTCLREYLEKSYSNYF
jgi:dTDP-4-dehydrorhamnose reductase